MACAFGFQACRLQLPGNFFSSELCENIGVAIYDGSLLKLKAELIKPSLLIIDDLGLGEISPQIGQILLDVVDRRMRSGSL
ncbi:MULTISPECIES: ATP-binding protein [Azospirillum]|uniref:ATP-binding protein n=1 Tax=Azospirillum TaxID=191 RepID=UPI00344C923F